jgi:hypothetical protein
MARSLLSTALAAQTGECPTDAMPLAVRIKALILAELIASFLTVGLVAARAVTSSHVAFIWDS